jgi:hypothetical protein
MLSAGMASHLPPRAARHLIQTGFQVLDSLRQALSVFIVRNATAITQHITIPVLAPTNAAIADFHDANATLQIIVGAREVLHIVTAHHMGSQVQKGLSKRFESLIELLRGL